ncbi:DgyrCDS4862 [Dimorphilus gyrociliatus]|uniref:DgyrCDS4862 n=1 Tax=Dimorphilus gyrociliatus TaxID=2664684 RepID=A0A7I8VI23_9ANNE|nr:DgyrCDS4862 [Dimorphilus gyrociliatus]
MGKTLSTVAQWTSAAGSKRLEFSPKNETILNSIVSFAENYASNNPEEAQMLFKKALVWKTKLRPSELNLNAEGDMFVSGDKHKSGQSLITYKKAGNEVSVHCLQSLIQLFSSAGDCKMEEARFCLEGNSDPLANMCGDRFATVDSEDNSTLRYVEEILKSKGQGKGEGEQDEENEKETEMLMIMRMVMTIIEFDNKLMKDSLVGMTHEIRLSPSQANREIDLLSKIAGKDEEKHALLAISYTKPYTYEFANGCRAPFHGQLKGDLCYTSCKLHDSDETLYVTANTDGWFVNKGPSDDKDKEFQKEEECYRSLVALLREKSAKFGENIDKQEFKKNQKSSLEKEIETENRGKRDGGRSNSQSKIKDDGGHDDRKHLKKKSERKLEPSVKWKLLGVSKTDEEESEKKKYGKPQSVTISKGSPLRYQSDDEPFEESSSESGEEEEIVERRPEATSDLPSEYWQIQKLVKYLKGGNQTATMIALCALRDFNLATVENCQLAVRDLGGLDVLINLLDTEESKCKMGALIILRDISNNAHIRRAIADLGGLQTMVKILRDPNKDLKCLAAETIANVARFRRARRTVRRHGGIKKLVGLLDCTLPKSDNVSEEEEKNIEVARSGALALWSCSKSTKNKESMRRNGAIPLLAQLLKSPHENMLIPVVGTLQECASEHDYRLAIRTEGMIQDLVKNLKSKNPELQMHCASAIFKCAEEKETRELVRKYGGLNPLVSLLESREDKLLLTAATGAIWKCSKSRENAQKFQELKTIDTLVSLLQDQPEEVLTNVVGALSELAQDPPNRLQIRKAGGLPALIELLTGTNKALLVNVTNAVGQCAEESSNMDVIDKLDGVRLLWSLLKNPSTEVQSSAAWAICPCIENAKDAGEMVRSFVGGLELIVNLLKSDDKEVLASVCAAIGHIAKDEENLAVITDHGVVPMLAQLTNRTSDKLRRHLAEAIARCCNWGKNRESFGNAKAVAPLVKYLKSKDMDVHRSTACALHELSKHPDNCITMHENGVVKLLIDMVGSKDDILQEAAAGCIGNIRRLALANERSKHK